MVNSDSQFARQYAGKLVTAISRQTDRAGVESAIASIYGQLGFSAPQVVWCDDMFQFASLPAIYRHLAAGTSINSLKLGSIFNRDKSVERLWEKAEALNVHENGLGSKLNTGLSRLLSTVSQNLTMASRRALGARMDSIEESMDEILGTTATWSMDNSPELTRSQCAVRSKLEGPDGQLSTDLLLGDAWGVWDLRWLATHACAVQVADSAVYSAEAARTQLNDWVELIQGGQAYLFFQNVCFVFGYPQPEQSDESKDRGMTLPVSPINATMVNGDWIRRLQCTVFARFKNMVFAAA